MRIYKFGGASVKDSDGVKNLFSILNKKGFDKTLLVISAMGKTTNSFELVVKNYFENKDELQYSINQIFQFHKEILLDLFTNQNHEIYNELHLIFENLKGFLKRNKSPHYSFVYDQVVPNGELLCTKIISAYLNFNGIKSKWIDSRDLIKTNSNYRDADLDWDATQKNILNKVDKNILNITQGFIGSNKNNFVTTLGREGSDYSAAIYAYCLNADSLTIWKDVPGLLNADPRVFQNPILLITFVFLLKHLFLELQKHQLFCDSHIFHVWCLNPFFRCYGQEIMLLILIQFALFQSLLYQELYFHKHRNY